jgi:hypothetical protein
MAVKLEQGIERQGIDREREREREVKPTRAGRKADIDERNGKR